jgi:NADH-quinone oxidoreductase subunit G
MLNAKIPRQTLRYSGRTAMNAQLAVSEPRVSQDPDSPLAFSMEGRQELPPSSLVPFYWTPGWNSVQAMYNYLDGPNGSMKGGDPGVKLIEPGEEHSISYFKTDLQVFEYRKDEWLIVPVYQIFGSEELSSAGSSLDQRIQEPFLYLNQKDAEILIIKDGEPIQLEVPGSKLRIKVKIENSIRQGMAGLSVNLPGMQFIDLPCRGKLIKQ